MKGGKTQQILPNENQILTCNQLYLHRQKEEMNMKISQRYFEFRMNPFIRGLTYPAGAIKKAIERQKYSKSIDSSEIRKFKDIHKGERCFIIGNGPSLTAEDLDLISNEYTFAANKIFALFEMTKWRPTYYFSVDFSVISNNFSEINKLECKKKFIDLWAKKQGRRSDNSIYICSNPFYIINIYGYKGAFIQEDISKYISSGLTVTFTMIQTAIYMGFKEIYLIGNDFSMPYYKDKYGRRHKTDEAHAHFKNGDTHNIVYLNRDSNLFAFEQAKKYCDSHGIIIKNVTRGGKLEVFERAELEEILS